MIYSGILIPNCSEFCGRLNFDNLTPDQIRMIKKQIKDWSEGTYDWKTLFPDDGEAYHLDVGCYGLELDGERYLIIEGHNGDHGHYVDDWLEGLGLYLQEFNPYDEDDEDCEERIGKDFSLDCDIQVRIK